MYVGSKGLGFILLIIGIFLFLFGILAIILGGTGEGSDPIFVVGLFAVSVCTAVVGQGAIKEQAWAQPLARLLALALAVGLVIIFFRAA